MSVHTGPLTVLDNPVWAALTGPHERFAQRAGLAVRYDPEVTRFATVADRADPRAWTDLATLVGPGGPVALSAADVDPPPGWTVEFRGTGVQLVDEGLVPADDPEAVTLGPADVPEMLDLVERTRPGPFLARTVELGTYLGIRRGGRLVAMAGERLHPPGYTEISAVCTDAAFRGRGLATRLVRAVAAGIRRRGETPFMHAAATNTDAIRLYGSIGFRLRRHTVFAMLTAP